MSGWRSHCSTRCKCVLWDFHPWTTLLIHPHSFKRCFCFQGPLFFLSPSKSFFPSFGASRRSASWGPEPSVSVCRGVGGWWIWVQLWMRRRGCNAACQEVCGWTDGCEDFVSHKKGKKQHKKRDEKLGGGGGKSVGKRESRLIGKVLLYINICMCARLFSNCQMGMATKLNLSREEYFWLFFLFDSLCNQPVKLPPWVKKEKVKRIWKIKN